MKTLANLVLFLIFTKKEQLYQSTYGTFREMTTVENLYINNKYSVKVQYHKCWGYLSNFKEFHHE